MVLPEAQGEAIPIAVITGRFVAPVITITATIAFLAGRKIATAATGPKPAESEDEA